MTDQQTYTDPYGDEVTLYGDRVREDVLDIFAPRSVVIPAAELLAMIDRAAPDAMRAYLRETAPEVIADLYRPEIREADSPEDIDERRLCDPLTDGDLADLREAGRTLGEAWREFRDAVRAGADR